MISSLSKPGMDALGAAQRFGQTRLGQPEHPDGLLPVDRPAGDRLLRSGGLQLPCATWAVARAAAREARLPPACRARPRPARCPPDRVPATPAGIMACLRLAALTESKLPGSKAAEGGIAAIRRLRMLAILFSTSSSSTSSRPQNRATTSTVMSSAVGPRPPLVTIRSTPWSAMKRSCASMSAGRSPQIVMCASSTPSSSSRSAIQGPFLSWTRPVRTSVPVTTMPARALTAMSLRMN